MRIVVVWVVALTMIGLIIICWYATLPALIGVSRALNASYYADANARNIATAVEYASYSWGGLICMFILLWAIISSSKRDVESIMYE